jgi:hypothetical protein
MNQDPSREIEQLRENMKGLQQGFDTLTAEFNRRFDDLEQWRTRNANNLPAVDAPTVIAALLSQPAPIPEGMLSAQEQDAYRTAWFDALRHVALNLPKP